MKANTYTLVLFLLLFVDYFVNALEVLAGGWCSGKSQACCFALFQVFLLSWANQPLAPAWSCTNVTEVSIFSSNSREEKRTFPWTLPWMLSGGGIRRRQSHPFLFLSVCLTPCMCVCLTKPISRPGVECQIVLTGSKTALPSEPVILQCRHSWLQKHTSQANCLNRIFICLCKVSCC